MMAPRPLLLFLPILLLLGCATPQLDSLLKDRPPVPPRFEISGVPFIEQSANHCGPASLAMTLGWSGKPVHPDELASALMTPEKGGTLQADLLGAARRRGYLAFELGSLRELLLELAASHPVIVLQNLGFDWHPIWHYAVATGYDLEERVIFLHSGKNERLPMNLALFERTWSRARNWGAVILPPQQLPATATEGAALRAAIALERVGLHSEAKAAYQSIRKRWPGSVGALFGLANAASALGEHSVSVEALEAATRLDPSAPALWHNLALVYSRQGRRVQASRAAQSALSRVSEEEKTQYEKELLPLVLPGAASKPTRH